LCFDRTNELRLYLDVLRVTGSNGGVARAHGSSHSSTVSTVASLGNPSGPRPSSSRARFVRSSVSLPVERTASAELAFSNRSDRFRPPPGPFNDILGNDFRAIIGAYSTGDRVAVIRFPKGRNTPGRRSRRPARDAVTPVVLRASTARVRVELLALDFYPRPTTGRWRRSLRAGRDQSGGGPRSVASTRPVRLRVRF